MSRPPVIGEIRASVVQIRCTLAERERWQRAAAARKTTIADLVRAALDAASSPASQTPLSASPRTSTAPRRKKTGGATAGRKPARRSK